MSPKPDRIQVLGEDRIFWGVLYKFGGIQPVQMSLPFTCERTGAILRSSEILYNFSKYKGFTTWCAHYFHRSIRFYFKTKLFSLSVNRRVKMDFQSSRLPNFDKSEENNNVLPDALVYPTSGQNVRPRQIYDQD